MNELLALISTIIGARPRHVQLDRARASPYAGGMEDDLFPPDLETFEAMAAEAFAALPRRFRDQCGGVAIRVADFADEETLRDMGVADPFELTGLYAGAPLTEKSEADVAPPPDLVWLYRRPILDEWAERGDTGLFELVSHVLVHEIGHHFGLSDEEIEAIEARP